MRILSAAFLFASHCFGTPSDSTPVGKVVDHAVKFSMSSRDLNGLMSAAWEDLKNRAIEGKIDSVKKHFALGMMAVTVENIEYKFSAEKAQVTLMKDNRFEMHLDVKLHTAKVGSLSTAKKAVECKDLSLRMKPNQSVIHVKFKGKLTMAEKGKVNMELVDAPVIVGGITSYVELFVPEKPKKIECRGLWFIPAPKFLVNYLPAIANTFGDSIMEGLTATAGDYAKQHAEYFSKVFKTSLTQNLYFPIGRDAQFRVKAYPSAIRTYADRMEVELGLWFQTDPDKNLTQFNEEAGDDMEDRTRFLCSSGDPKVECSDGGMSVQFLQNFLNELVDNRILEMRVSPKIYCESKPKPCDMETKLTVENISKILLPGLGKAVEKKYKLDPAYEAVVGEAGVLAHAEMLRNLPVDMAVHHIGAIDLKVDPGYPFRAKPGAPMNHIKIDLGFKGLNLDVVVRDEVYGTVKLDFNVKLYLSNDLKPHIIELGYDRVNMAAATKDSPYSTDGYAATFTVNNNFPGVAETPDAHTMSGKELREMVEAQLGTILRDMSKNKILHKIELKEYALDNGQILTFDKFKLETIKAMTLKDSDVTYMNLPFKVEKATKL